MPPDTALSRSSRSACPIPPVERNKKKAVKVSSPSSRWASSPWFQPADERLPPLIVQVLAVVGMIVLVVVELNADAPSVSGIRVSVLLVLLSLLGKSRPSADVADRSMISAFGEMLAGAIRADGARPPLSGTHYGPQRRCCAKVDAPRPSETAAADSLCSRTFKGKAVTVSSQLSSARSALRSLTVPTLLALSLQLPAHRAGPLPL